MTEEYFYHIYAKDQCLYNCLREKEFKEKWEEIKMIVGLMKTDYTEEDLTYIKLPANSGGNGRGSVGVPSGDTEPPGEPSY